LEEEKAWSRRERAWRSMVKHKFLMFAIQLLTAVLFLLATIAAFTLERSANIEGMLRLS
jgi:hypothetical protein